jgi:epoxyqueuosine reductase
MVAAKEAIKGAARALGFDLAGVATAGAWPTGEALASWLAGGMHGEMAYMAEAPLARLDPRRTYPWARTCVVVAADYRVEAPAAAPPARRPFSRYAWGDDYHPLLEKRLKALKRDILRIGGPGAEARWYVDFGPVLERAAAAAAGIGWHAKNTMLIHERRGSWLFLGSVLTSLDLPLDRAAPGRCGSCARCLDACPTRAFRAPYLLDARRCISYLTIELQGPIPRELRPLMGEMVFGCDICQEVCPWNERAERREPPAADPAFAPRPGLAGEGGTEALLALLSLDEAGFRARFRRSAARRPGRVGIARNAAVALGNRGDPAALPALLTALSGDPSPLVRGHAAWAVGRVAAALPASDPRREEARAGLERATAEMGEGADADPGAREEARLALEGLEPPRA